MKTRAFVAALCALFAGFAPVPASAVELVIEPDTLSPSTTVELRFDTPMVGKDRVGSVEQASPLVAAPAVKGEFRWTSSRSGQFRFTQPPSFATSYKFALRPGMKDVEGTAVEATDLGEFATEGLKVADEWRSYPYYSGDSAQRTPFYILQFNDRVNPAEIAKQAYFVSKSSPTRVPATVRLATGKDFKKQYHAELVQTWDEQISGTKPKIGLTDTRPNAIVLETTTPLPIGQDWQLVLPATISNATGNATLEGEDTRTWGNILPLGIKRLVAEPHFDRPHSIDILFNKAISSNEIPPAQAAQRIAPFIHVEPPVPGLKVEASYQSVAITGEFTLHQPYTVTLAAGFPGADGLALATRSKDTVTFQPSPVYVSTTATTNTQLSSGKGIFDVYAANYKDLRLRVKQLSDGELLKARALYDESYDPHATDTNKSAQKVKDNPFESFPGTVIYDQTYANDKPLQQATYMELKWKDILGQRPAAPVFIELLATSQDQAPGGTIVNRAIVEFTDIGLLVKGTDQEALIYAFSLKTGQPLTGVQLTLADAQRGFLKVAQTDAQGFAKVPSKGAEWVLATKDQDCTSMNLGSRGDRIGMWGHGINIAWESPFRDRFETFIFSDRPVYKPGDTAHVKAITRHRNGDSLTLGGKPATATMVLTDERNRTVQTKPVTFTANGTWADDITFPDSTTGWYSLRLEFPKTDATGNPLPAAANEDDEDAQIANLELRVDDYKPNTFEVKLEGNRNRQLGDRVKVPLTAKYYMGKALSSAKVSWSASLAEDYVPPTEWADYHFGDAPAFWHYGQKDRDDETADSDEEESQFSWGAHGELTLNDDGTVDIEMPAPPLHKASLPQTVSIYADVTDVNQQTISSTTEFKLPGADFIVGAKKQSWYATAGKPFSFELAAITPQGQSFTAPVGVDVKVERMEWNTVRVEGAGGAITTKNQSRIIDELKTSVQLSSSNGRASAGTLSFTPKQGGTYFLTATATDAQGRTVLTRVPFYAVGGTGFPWSWEDGSRITLQPDKTTVKPGEEVSIVVKTPFAGQALVTVERNSVLRHLVAPVSPENPVVKLKMTDEDGPNAFVSVIVMRGAAGSPQPDPMPEYKVGYCELTVPSDKKRLFVEAKPSSDTVRPGEELSVTATVTDAGKQPVAGADVTLYAVDEGVLSLMSYLTPQPFEFFHMPMALAVNSYSTLDSLLEEAMDDRYRGNKGIVIGGGGDDADPSAALRKNFVATALWSATLTTDAQGKVNATFKAPDSLTRYRIMAVAAKDADRFGSGESKFVVNKPLMVEPVVPRFAHLGDEILIKGIVHNTTPHDGSVELELTLDDNAILITEQRPFALVGVRNRITMNASRSERRPITLKAGETAAVAFPVRFVKTGTTTWKWQVRTTTWAPGAPALSDAVESKFEVNSPIPALREVQYFELTSASASQNLLQRINPQLLESEGDLNLSFSQSRLYEARDALDQTLHYPYGCVEQTSSATLPWLALSRYEAMFPDLLQKAKANDAISKGVRRLLAMQTDSGGLSYWPGGDTPVYWGSAYGAFVLMKAKEWGVPVPQDSLDKLTDYLSKGLREFDLAASTENEKLTDAAMGLYVLAKAGKTEPAYATLLFQRREKLPETARLYLALSMCLNNGAPRQIAELIKAPAKRTPQHRYWAAPELAHPLRLLVATHLGMKAEAQAAATELLRTRTGRGDWGTTFGNAWSLLALSAAERPAKDAAPNPLTLVANWQGTPNQVVLGDNLASQAIQFPLKRNGGPAPLSVALPDTRPVMGRLEVKSYPDLKTFQPVSKGFTIRRKYERLTPIGTREAAKNLRVGDLIVVTLDITVDKANRYMAINDPLPSVFEPVNPEFVTQNQRQNEEGEDNAWFCDHRELRSDRALFFTNDATEQGQFELKYLARVIAEGDVIVPPTRIEAMYEPNHYGLGEIQRVMTLPMGDGSDVVAR